MALAVDTQRALARMAGELGYDDPPPVPRGRARRAAGGSAPPGMYGWAEALDACGDPHIVRVCGPITPIGAEDDRQLCVDAGSGRRVLVPRGAFARRMSARDACLTAGFAVHDVEDTPGGPESADPWWLERRRNPAFIAAFDYAACHPELPTTGRLLQMLAARRDDDHDHGGEPRHRGSLGLSQFACWQVQRPFDEGADVVEALHAWVLDQAAQPYWWYVRYDARLKPETVWRRHWRAHATAIAERIGQVRRELRLRGLDRPVPQFDRPAASGAMIPMLDDC